MGETEREMSKKLGEEWGQAKQWSQYFEKKTLRSINTSLRQDRTEFD